MPYKKAQKHDLCNALYLIFVKKFHHCQDFFASHKNLYVASTLYMSKAVYRIDGQNCEKLV